MATKQQFDLWFKDCEQVILNCKNDIQEILINNNIYIYNYRFNKVYLFGSIAHYKKIKNL